jgi:P-type E1-E2 ATPase
VKYIFSDKTGTLTRNVMDFKKCTIAENIYTLDETPYDTQLVKVMFAVVQLNPLPFPSLSSPIMGREYQELRVKPALWLSICC